MTECFETITQLQIGLYTVRVWAAVPGFTFGETALKDELQLINGRDPKHIFEALKKLPGIAACEIKGTNGIGIVWYREWP